MQLVKVIPHGSLKDRFSSFEVAGETSAEVLEGWSRQLGIHDLPEIDRPIVSVVDYDTDQKLYAKLKKSVKELHIFPAMFGGGGFGKIILGGLQIVAGVLLMPIQPAIGAALIVSGVTTALVGIVELFMGSPSLSKEDDPDASKYIGTGRNTTAIGTPIGIGGGRMKIGGQFLSLQVNSSELVHGIFPDTTT